jgi:hypothetical protein
LGAFVCHRKRNTEPTKKNHPHLDQQVEQLGVDAPGTRGEYVQRVVDGIHLGRVALADQGVLLVGRAAAAAARVQAQQTGGADQVAALVGRVPGEGGREHGQLVGLEDERGGVDLGEHGVDFELGVCVDARGAVDLVEGVLLLPLFRLGRLPRLDGRFEDDSFQQALAYLVACRVGPRLDFFVL